MTSGTPNGLNALWGSSSTDIFAVGDKGTVIHYDGDGDNNGSPDDIWELMNSGTDVKLLGVWGNSSTDVYAVGNSHKEEYWKRTVIHYDGISWEEVPTGNGVTLMSPWGSATDDITAAGSFGSIMRYKEWVEGEGAEWKQIGGELPHADWEIYPKSAWNYALQIDVAYPEKSVEFTSRPVGDCPFSPDGAPVQAKVKGRRIPECRVCGRLARGLHEGPKPRPKSGKQD